MAKKFNLGDKVRLVSGGPVMAVQQVPRINDLYRCQWFAGKKLESGQFPPESLVEVTDDDAQKKSQK